MDNSKKLEYSFKMTKGHVVLFRPKYKLMSEQMGVSLIELMVAMVIGLVVSLAIYGVLNVNEARKRTTTSTNDIDQSGAYTIYQFSKILRSAGSGFSATSTTMLSNSIGYALGCGLRAAKGGAAVLPASSAYPQPFAAVPTALRLAPVIIFPNAAVSGATVNGDVVMTMAGSGGLSESLTDFALKPTTTTLTLNSVAGFRPNDIILVTDNTGGPGVANCLVEQVASTFSPVATSLAMQLGGTYYTTNVGATNLTDFSSATPTPTSSALNLGQIPIFNMFGVGDNNRLYSYDLLSPASNNLNAAGANPSVFADSVYAMYAIYGVDGDNNPATTTLTWTLPTGNYTPANLLAGTVAANALLENIKAIKVVVIMQSALPERIPAGQSAIASPGFTFTGSGSSATGSVTLFSNELATPITKTVTPVDRRYRVFETTIPIRNSLIIPN